MFNEKYFVRTTANMYVQNKNKSSEGYKIARNEFGKDYCDSKLEYVFLLFVK
jgi:hypothetical protein